MNASDFYNLINPHDRYRISLKRRIAIATFSTVLSLLMIVWALVAHYGSQHAGAVSVWPLWLAAFGNGYVAVLAWRIVWLLKKHPSDVES
jgi:hypothetical protein